MKNIVCRTHVFTLISRLQMQNIKCVTEEISLYSPKIRKGEKKKEKKPFRTLSLSHTGRLINSQSIGMWGQRLARKEFQSELLSCIWQLDFTPTGLPRIASNQQSAKISPKLKRISIITGGISSLFLMMERSQFTSDILFARVFVVVGMIQNIIHITESVDI